MNLFDQFSTFTKNLSNLGQGKLIALAVAGVVAIGFVLGAGIYVNRPSFETLYVGLERSDVTQISIALAEANVDFEVGTDGGSIQVPSA